MISIPQVTNESLKFTMRTFEDIKYGHYGIKLDVIFKIKNSVSIDI